MESGKGVFICEEKVAGMSCAIYEIASGVIPVFAEEVPSAMSNAEKAEWFDKNFQLLSGAFWCISEIADILQEMYIAM